jgi:hypothetical protein
MQKDEIREWLIALLETDTCNGWEVDDCEFCQYVDANNCYTERTVDHLLANGVTVQRWIPVSEQLPTEEDEDVSGCVLAIERQDGFARRWDANSVRNCPELFAHWMPLPEPPKEET